MTNEKSKMENDPVAGFVTASSHNNPRIHPPSTGIEVPVM